MRVRVLSFCRYLTSIDDEWTSSQHAAKKFIDAIKGRDVNKYAMIPTVNGRRRLTEHNASKALDWFAEWAANKIYDHIDDGCVIVPVPSSDMISGSRFDFTTRTIAEKVVAFIRKTSKDDVVVADILRWKKKVAKAHKGGTRNENEIYSRLEVSAANTTPGKCILVDDVVTSGAHMRAAVRKLKEINLEVIMAVSAGRTTRDTGKKAFSPPAIYLDEV